jgi:hypothetical protein
MMEAVFLAGYLFTITACSDSAGCKKVVAMMLPSEAVCAVWEKKLEAAIPESTPAFWGFDQERPVQVTHTCRKVNAYETRL